MDRSTMTINGRSGVTTPSVLQIGLGGTGLGREVKGTKTRRPMAERL
jgi:hypothetical protein